MSKFGYISYGEMEKITIGILNNLGVNLNWNGTVNKIDIDYIIEFEYDLEIVWENIDFLDEEGTILAAIKPADKIIIMNESKKKLFTEKMGTMNFSKAHELGHWVLHVTEQKGYEQLTFLPTDVYHCRNLIKREPEEIQADMFAASLLMPKNIITCAVNNLKEKGYVTFPELYALKDQFEVSISALVNRITILKLLYIKDKKIYLSEDEVTGQLSLF